MTRIVPRPIIPCMGFLVDLSDLIELIASVKHVSKKNCLLFLDRL
jgi:hypothetical protein